MNGGYWSYQLDSIGTGKGQEAGEDNRRELHSNSVTERRVRPLKWS